MRFSAIFIALSFSLLAPTNAATPIPPLQIGLEHDFAHTTSIIVSPYGPNATLYDARGRVITRCTDGLVLQITPSSKGGLTIKKTAAGGDKGTFENDGIFTIKPEGQAMLQIARLDGKSSSSLAVKWHVYRGLLTVRREPDNTMRVINTVELEQYLYGVLPAEIGTKAPVEALRAQAVAARTYALKNRQKFAAEGFDLDDTTRCEGYLGYSGEASTTTAAVDGTRGQVLTYAGKLIDAPYSTDSGGVTACDMSGSCPYLQAVKDAPETGGPDYAADSAWHHWNVTFTKAQLQAAFAKDSLTRVTQFASLVLNTCDPSGRIVMATVSGTDGTTKTITGSQMRRILGYDQLRSTKVTLKITPTGDYAFEGWGWGHGLGMSQLGAVAMASPPYRKNYRQILAHYYVGTNLAEITQLTPQQSASARRGL